MNSSVGMKSVFRLVRLSVIRSQAPHWKHHLMFTPRMRE